MPALLTEEWKNFLKAVPVEHSIGNGQDAGVFLYNHRINARLRDGREHGLLTEEMQVLLWRNCKDYFNLKYDAGEKVANACLEMQSRGVEILNATATAARSIAISRSMRYYSEIPLLSEHGGEVASAILKTVQQVVNHPLVPVLEAALFLPALPCGGYAKKRGPLRRGARSAYRRAIKRLPIYAKMRPSSATISPNRACGFQKAWAPWWKIARTHAGVNLPTARYCCLSPKTASPSPGSRSAPSAPSALR